MARRKSAPEPPLRHRIRQALPAVAIVAVAAAHSALVGASLPGIRSIPGWFYSPSARGLGAGWSMAALVVLTPWLVRVTLRAARAGRHAPTLVAALALGLVTQTLFVPLDARREESLLARHEGGHGEFHAIALARRGQLVDTLRRYEELVAKRELGVFAPTKPPGALAVYAGLDALGRGPLHGRLEGLRELARRNARVARYEDGFVAAVVVLPLLTALVLPLLVWLGALVHRRAPHEGGLLAGAGTAVITATSPALLLVTYHLDGALYPLIATLALLLTSLAMCVGGSRRAHGLSLSARVLLVATLAGVVIALGVYVSFSLLPALAMMAVLVLCFALAAPPASRPLARASLVFLGVALGAFATTALLMLTLNFDPLPRFHAAMAYHARWKEAVPLRPWRLWSLLEWSLYAGFPLVALLLVRALGSLGSLRDLRVAPGTLLPVAVVALLGALALHSGTNEVARMWLFMVPFAALAVSSERTTPERVELLAGAQLVVALVMKANQPW